MCCWPLGFHSSGCGLVSVGSCCWLWLWLLARIAAQLELDFVRDIAGQLL